MNYIIIRNITEAQVQDTVSDLVDLYHESGFVNSVIINRVEVNHYMIELPGNPDFERFAYFVNYLAYPENNPDDKRIVYGVWNEARPNPDMDSENGEKLLVYVSRFDTEHDNVNIENSKGKIYKYSFSGQMTGQDKHELDYRELTVFPEHYTELIEIVPSKDLPKYEVKPWWKFW